MRAIKNNKIIDYLWLNGCSPEYEIFGTAFYRTGKRFQELMDKYYIEYTLIPNRLGSY